MNKWKLMYYKVLSSFLPNLFLMMTLWTCFDLFITALIMTMLLYLLFALFFFYTEDQALGEQIRVATTDFLAFDRKQD